MPCCKHSRIWVAMLDRKYGPDMSKCRGSIGVSACDSLVILRGLKAESVQGQGRGGKGE